MKGLLDLSDALDVLVRVEIFLGRFVRGDWKRVAKKHGAVGVLGEVARAAVGANAWELRVPRSHGLRGREVIAFLHKYGIRTWGARITDDHLILTIEERQARWAEYLMLRRGVPLDGLVFDKRNLTYAQKYAPGDQPPAWQDRDDDSDWLNS